MRTIKFRAWDTTNRKMIPWESMQAWVIGSVQNENIMQFTGLLDNNGMEIYEGDIVQDKSWGRYEVVWVKKYARFELRPLESKSSLLISEDDYVEIIGNIYSNPELLNL